MEHVLFVEKNIMINLDCHKNTEYKPCPICGGQPTIETSIYGYTYYVLCESCGWYGDLIELEVTPLAAMSHWNNK